MRLPTRPDDRVLVVIPVYGQQEMTHALLGDLDREASRTDVVVVDNRGDYRAAGGERVLRPGSNLGWAGGTNHGTTTARNGHTAFVWLNNDTRLSRGFVRGLLRSWHQTGAHVLAPVYDCHWRHQRLDPLVPVEAFRPRPVTSRAPFVDGTCMFVPADTVDAIGLLDADAFAPLGWGAEIDYCLRARAAGLTVAVTERAYLHHERAVTAQAVFGDYDEYLATAYPPALEALRTRWGDWERLAEVELPEAQTRPLDASARLGARRRPSIALPLVRQLVRATAPFRRDRAGTEEPPGADPVPSGRPMGPSGPTERGAGGRPDARPDEPTVPPDR